MSEIDLRFDATDDGTPPPTERREADAKAAAPATAAGTGTTAVEVEESVVVTTADRGLIRLPRPLSNRLNLEGAAAALRALPYGGVDDGALSLRLPPAIHATISPVVAALRWGAVMFAMVSAVTRANNGDYAVVSAVSVVLFLTTWRTLRPIRLG
jgi:hypothetical protein